MIPKDFFEDEITVGVATGAFKYSLNSRFTLVNLGYGFGKTIISVLTAVYIAKYLKQDVQIAIIGTKAKRLDKSFQDAIASAEVIFNIKLPIVHINGQEVGTFTGFNKVASNTKSFNSLMSVIERRPTIFILDETHMTLRASTSKTAKAFKKLFDQAEKKNCFIKAIGLTATPFDLSIIDSIGYLVFNGDYRSQTDFYKKEVVGIKDARSRGLTQNDIKNLIIDKNYKINKEMFYDIRSVLSKLNRIIYAPEAPRNFHIPTNEIIERKVKLSSQGYEKLNKLKELSDYKAFRNSTSMKNQFISSLTVDTNILNEVLSIIRDDSNIQPLIFYFYNTQKEALQTFLNKHSIKFVQVNAESQSFFDEDENLVNAPPPVLVQYKSGAVSFESKISNCSIYLNYPESSIEFEQSLGRNTRRNQSYEIIKNYFILPVDENSSLIPLFSDQYYRIKNKRIRNEMFLKTFKSDWGDLENQTIDSFQ